jgi:hypothetical protein
LLNPGDALIGEQGSQDLTNALRAETVDPGLDLGLHKLWAATVGPRSSSGLAHKAKRLAFGVRGPLVVASAVHVSGDNPAAAISDRYRVLRELGRGGMGVVYLAHDQQRDMEVAIKLCTYPQLSPLHIKREFRIAASLRHPNLVEFYELTYHKHQAYFTMEYIDGSSLRSYV